jgi:hypothetical protein
MPEMFVGEALIELKTLMDRIRKKRMGSVFTLVKTKVKNSHVKEADFSSKAMSDFQSVCDLMVRWHTLKTKIDISNGVTQVMIDGKMMLVVEVIQYKKVIAMEAELLTQMKQQKMQVTTELDSHSERLQANIDKKLELMCGKEAKPDQGSLDIVTSTMTKADPIEMFDPLKLDKKIQDLEDKIDNWTSKVDFALSNSNATTKIIV